MTRPGSTSTIPEGVKAVEVDYDNEESLVSALQGQQFFVITLSISVPPDTHSKLVRAAVKAGVPYIMPNVYGSDIANRSLCEEDLYGGPSRERCEDVQSAGASYIGMVCGFWYESSLAAGEYFFGFDIPNRKVTFFDDGKTTITVSTLRQCGRAVAGLLSLPEGGGEVSVSQWKNKPFYVSSFRVNQRDMLDSLHRVCGTTDKDWEIKYQPSKERYREGIDNLGKHHFAGFAKAMYTRSFFPGGGGDFESTRGTANALLGLPKEDLDAATKRAVELTGRGGGYA